MSYLSCKLQLPKLILKDTPLNYQKILKCLLIVNLFFRFASHVPDHVEWVRFSDEVESIFTIKELEKAPLLEVEQFKPPVDWQMNQLSDEDASLCLEALKRLAEKVCIYI